MLSKKLEMAVPMSPVVLVKLVCVCDSCETSRTQLLSNLGFLLDLGFKNRVLHTLDCFQVDTGSQGEWTDHDRIAGCKHWDFSGIAWSVDVGNIIRRRFQGGPAPL